MTYRGWIRTRTALAVALLLLATPTPSRASFMDTLGNLWNRGTEAVGNLWDKGKETVSGWLNGRRASNISGLLDQIEQAQQEAAERAANLQEFTDRLGGRAPSESVRPFLEERIRDLESARRTVQGLYEQLGPAAEQAARDGSLKPEERERIGKIQRDQQTLEARLGQLASATSGWASAGPDPDSSARPTPTRDELVMQDRARQPATPVATGQPVATATDETPTDLADPAAGTQVSMARPPPNGPGGPDQAPLEDPEDSPAAPGTAEGTATQRFVDDARLLGSEGGGEAAATGGTAPPPPTTSPLLAAMAEEQALKEKAGVQESPPEEDAGVYGAGARPAGTSDEIVTSARDGAGAEVRDPTGTGTGNLAGSDAQGSLPSLGEPAGGAASKADGPLDPEDPEVASLIDEWLGQVGLDSYGRWVEPDNITARGSADTDGRSRSRYVWDNLQNDSASSSVSLADYVRRRLRGEQVLVVRRSSSMTGTASQRPSSRSARSRSDYLDVRSSLEDGDRDRQRSAYERMRSR